MSRRNGRRLPMFRAAGAPSTVLLAGENREVIGRIRALLERHGCSVLLGRSGEEVVRIARRGAVDVILMDMVLPILDGYACARLLRKDRATSHIPIIGYNAPRQRGKELTRSDEQALLERIEEALETRNVNQCCELTGTAKGRR